MPVQRITAVVGLVSPAGSTVATLSASSVTLSEDEGTAPYATASVTVAMPTAAQFAMMKPGAGYYLSILTYPESSPETVPMLLRITDRNRGTAGNVELQAASAEVDILAFTPPSVDRSNWPRQSAVTSILSAVLGRVFGTNGWARYTYADSDSFGQDIGAPQYLTYRAASNLVSNGGFERDVVGWTAQQSNIARTSVVAHSGAYSMAVTPANANSSSRAEFTANLQPGGTYTFSAWLRTSAVMTGSGTTGRYLSIVGTVSGVQQILFNSPSTPNTANTWTRISVTFTAPPILDANGVLFRIVNGTSSSNSVTLYVDDVLLVEGDGLETDATTPIAYFDGDTTDGTGGYNYDWQGTAGQSASVRTPVVQHEAESLTWSPGQSAWDFLQPILQAVGVRLWSTGYAVLNGAVVAKLFYATNSFGLSLAAPRVLDGYNLFDLSQVDSWSAEFPDGTPMYADQVIVHYAWTDNLGVAQEAYDVYPATGKKPYYLDKPDTPFPGVGRAQAIYNRVSARATMFQGTTWFDRGIEPGRQLSITSARAAGGSALGYIEAVTHDVGRGTAEFRTKQTVAYTSASWFAATGSWASQTGSWAADK